MYVINLLWFVLGTILLPELQRASREKWCLCCKQHYGQLVILISVSYGKNALRKRALFVKRFVVNNKFSSCHFAFKFSALITTMGEWLLCAHGYHFQVQCFSMEAMQTKINLTNWNIHQVYFRQHHIYWKSPVLIWPPAEKWKRWVEVVDPHLIMSVRIVLWKKYNQ